MTPSTVLGSRLPPDPQQMDQAFAHFREEYLGLPPGDRRSLREWLYRLEALAGLGTSLHLGVEVIFNGSQEVAVESQVAISPIELQRAIEIWESKEGESGQV